MYSNRSSTDSVRTPPYILNYVKKHWGNFYDPVPYQPNFNPKIHPDGLVIPWKDVNYINPPFSRAKKFVMRGWQLYVHAHKKSIFLVKANIVASQYFGKLSQDAELRFFSHHITFPGYSKPAPFALMLVIFDGKNPGKYSVIPREVCK